MKHLIAYSLLILIIGALIGAGINSAIHSSKSDTIDSLQHDNDRLRRDLSTKDSIIIRQWIMIQPCEFRDYYTDTIG